MNEKLQDRLIAIIVAAYCILCCFVIVEQFTGDKCSTCPSTPQEQQNADMSTPDNFRSLLADMRQGMADSVSASLVWLNELGEGGDRYCPVDYDMEPAEPLTPEQLKAIMSEDYYIVNSDNMDIADGMFVGVALVRIDTADGHNITIMYSTLNGQAAMIVDGAVSDNVMLYNPDALMDLLMTI